jgi:chaperonin GroEL
MPQRNVLFQGQAREALMRGVNRMTRAISPTLGPVGRTVAIARIGQAGPPEILDSSMTIARRTLRVEDPFESMGSRLVRDLVIQITDLVGDGAATSAVLTQQLLARANKYVAAGGNPMILKRGIEKGLIVALDELDQMVSTVELPSELAAVVAGTVRDSRLSEMIGEVVEAVGPDGAVLFEDSQRPETTHRFIEGVRWNSGVASAYLFEQGQSEIRMRDPRILVTDVALKGEREMLPVIEACVRCGARTLFIIAPEIGDGALALLIANRKGGALDNAVAVKAPAAGAQRQRILEDLAVICGARYLNRRSDDDLEQLLDHDLGSARQVWATRFAFGIIGGAGSRGAVRQRLEAVRGELRAVGEDHQNRSRIQERIGKLSGSAASISVGAQTAMARDELRLRLEAAVASARLALRDGVIPGGGAALIGCQSALDKLRLPGDEGVGVRILAEALSGPMRVIAQNAGVDPSPIVHEARSLGPSWTFDARGKTWVNAREEGILDPVVVAKEALRAAVSVGVMALTTEALIRKEGVNWDDEQMRPRRRRSV